MNKEKLELFLQKINLGGLVEKVYVETDDEHTKVSAVDKEGNLVINCKADKIFETSENIGIYDLTQFIRYLGLLQAGEIKYKLYKTDKDEYYKIALASGKTNIDFTLSSKENIPEAKELKKEPNVSFTFKVNEDLSSTIIKSLDTSGHKILYFVYGKKGLILNIGDIKSKDHIVKIKLDNIDVSESFNGKEDTNICFSAGYLRSILSYNKIGTIKIALDGLMIFSGKEDNIHTSYYQRSLIQKEI